MWCRRALSKANKKEKFVNVYCKQKQHVNLKKKYL